MRRGPEIQHTEQEIAGVNITDSGGASLTILSDD